MWRYLWDEGQRAEGPMTFVSQMPSPPCRLHHNRLNDNFRCRSVVVDAAFGWLRHLFDSGHRVVPLRGTTLWPSSHRYLATHFFRDFVGCAYKILEKMGCKADKFWGASLLRIFGFFLIFCWRSQQNIKKSQKSRTFGSWFFLSE